MLDPQLLRENPEFVAQQLLRRGVHFDVKAYLALEQQRKTLQQATEQLQHDRNVFSKQIGQSKARGENADDLLKQVTAFGQELEKLDKQLNVVVQQIQAFTETLPNLPHVSVPNGKDETDNLEIRRYGTPKQFSFSPLSHEVLGEKLEKMDFSTAAKITGSRFVVLKDSISKLHRALAQWMLDLHTEKHGYTEVYVPYIVNQDSLYGTGQLPKFEGDLFKLRGDNGYYLASTAEIPVTNLVRDTILQEEALPLKWVCHSPCFRSEAGSYGKDTKGMIRQHQFEKVELVWISTPDKSYESLELLLTHAEMVLKLLDLPYRVVTLCTGDLGNAAKTYDLEVWLPSQNQYREISSCSNLEAYQARRMQTRYKSKESGKNHLVHTLNGSGLAVGRTLVAILENYQTASGSIVIPEVLRSYFKGKDIID